MEMMTVCEVAEMLRTSASALYTQRHRDEAPGALGARVGRRILWRRSDIENWFDGQRNDAGLSADVEPDTTPGTKREGHGE